jgi:MFS family permease
MTATKHSHTRGQLLPWVIWGAAASFVFFDCFQQVIPGVIGPSLIESFHVDAAALGTFSAFYFYSYAAMQIPVGLITDHLGSHRPMVAAALIAAGGSALFAMSGGLAMAQISRMIIGFGTAFAYVSCLKLGSHWFPHNRFATLVGLTSMVGMLGAIVGEAPIADAVEHLGWRETSGALVVVAGVLALLIWRIIRDHPPGASRWEDYPEHKRGVLKTLEDLKHVVGKWQTWVIGLYIAMMNVTFVVFGEVWGITFIQKAYNINEVNAAAAVSMLFVGGLLGGISWGLLSDRIRQRRLPMILAASGGLVVMIVILYAPIVQHLQLPAIYALLGLQGFCCNGLILGWALANDVRPPGSAGVSLGFVNMCATGVAILCLRIIGWLLDTRAPERAAQGILALNVADLRFVLTFPLVCLSMALLAAFFCRETHSKLLYDKG